DVLCTYSFPLSHSHCSVSAPSTLEVEVEVVGGARHPACTGYNSGGSSRGSRQPLSHAELLVLARLRLAPVLLVRILILLPLHLLIPITQQAVEVVGHRFASLGGGRVVVGQGVFLAHGRRRAVALLVLLLRRVLHSRFRHGHLASLPDSKRRCCDHGLVGVDIPHEGLRIPVLARERHLGWIHPPLVDCNGAQAVPAHVTGRLGQAQVLWQHLVHALRALLHLLDPQLVACQSAGSGVRIPRGQPAGEGHIPLDHRDTLGVTSVVALDVLVVQHGLVGARLGTHRLGRLLALFNPYPLLLLVH
ncbi:hypothetical protein B484DRAFT_465879, partial [Ochromonadaceae sp. CCMP2298]